jgi:hypothetical protein
MTQRRPASPRTIARAAMLAALCAPALLGACSGRAPQMRVGEAVIRQRTPEGAVAYVSLEATNTGNRPMPLRTAMYRAPGFAGQREVLATLDAGATVRFELPVALSEASATSADVDLRGSVEYVPASKLRALLAPLWPLPRATFGGVATIARDESGAGAPGFAGTAGPVVRTAQRVDKSADAAP